MAEQVEVEQKSMIRIAEAHRLLLLLMVLVGLPLPAADAQEQEEALVRIASAFAPATAETPLGDRLAVRPRVRASGFTPRRALKAWARPTACWHRCRTAGCCSSTRHGPTRRPSGSSPGPN